MRCLSITKEIINWNPRQLYRVNIEFTELLHQCYELIDFSGIWWHSHLLFTLFKSQRSQISAYNLQNISNLIWFLWLSLDFLTFLKFCVYLFLLIFYIVFSLFLHVLPSSSCKALYSLCFGKCYTNTFGLLACFL